MLLSVSCITAVFTSKICDMKNKPLFSKQKKIQNVQYSEYSVKRALSQMVPSSLWSSFKCDEVVEVQKEEKKKTSTLIMLTNQLSACRSSWGKKKKSWLCRLQIRHLHSYLQKTGVAAGFHFSQAGTTHFMFIQLSSISQFSLE